MTKILGLAHGLCLVSYKTQLRVLNCMECCILYDLLYIEMWHVNKLPTYLLTIACVCYDLAYSKGG